MLAALLAALLALAPAAAVQQANIFGTDDRMLVERAEGSPFGAIAVVVPVGPGDVPRYGSGVLIGPCHLLTAHHVAFPGPVEASPAMQSRVWMGPPHRGFPFTESAIGTPVVWGDLGNHQNEDWALLQLDPCLGLRWGWWELLPLRFEEAQALGPGFGTAGHPARETREAVTIDPSCSIRAQVGRIPGWYHDCAISSGQSGGPIFLAGADGRPRVVALVIGDFSPQEEVIPAWDPRAANVAIPVANFLARVQSALMPR